MADFDLLDQLCWQYGTDKGTKCRVRSAKGYSIAYAAMWGRIRHEPLTILELGALRGASLRVWSEWFPAAHVHGVDIIPVDAVADRVWLHKGDYTDGHWLTGVAERHGPFDIIIDDCDHKALNSLAAYILLRPHLRSGGWYAIEDMHADALYSTVVETISGAWHSCHLPEIGAFRNSLAIFRKP